jgi:beta-glucosidase
MMKLICKLSRSQLTAVFFFCASGMLYAQNQTENRLLYKDASQPIENRITDLLQRMSLDEKVAQMLCIWGDKSQICDDSCRFDVKKAQKCIPGGIGHIARPSDYFFRAPPGVTRGPRETVEFVNSIQRYMVEKTRWGIPALFHEEGLHGLQARDATQFPQAIALASTWDRTLVEQVYTIVAREIRLRGVYLVLAPVVDVVRDPRWGRSEETFGEDPFLVAEMGIAAVKGFQGTALPLGSNSVLATLKHMTGHGQPESGTNTGPAAVPERMLRESFLPPFERAVKETGIMCIMASYNEIDGIPSHANRFLLTDILRGEWGFKGIVVSDYTAISELMSRHHVAGSLESAATQALDAGVDVELPDWDAYRLLPALVRAGKVKEASIDTAVRRILRAKFSAGLFEHPFADAEAAERITGNAEARECALTAAQKSIILLKNDNHLLPLNLEECKHIAVIGPNAAETILGGYSGTPRQSISILEGVRKKVGDKVKVDFAQGVRITTTRNWYNDTVHLADAEENRRLIKEAVATVKNADHAIVVIGDNEETSREGWREDHLGDRSSLDLVGQQEELVRAIVATGVPTVAILINGRPLTVNYIAEHVPAVLEGWYLGQETGTAVADVLFGNVNPGGKLTVTIPRSVGQLPMFYNKKPTARRGYLFGTTEPLFPFGYGLSYTTFRFENLRLSTSKITTGDNADVRIDIVNTGKRIGDEVVQLYLHDIVSSVTRPVKELKGFRRITLAPGERRTVAFTLTPADLAFYDRHLQRVVEPGEFEVAVGPNSVDLKTVVLTVTGKK